MLCRFAFATDRALIVVFCGEAAVHRLSWNALRLLSITTYEELGGVDDTLFSLLMSRPQVSLVVAGRLQHCICQQPAHALCLSSP